MENLKPIVLKLARKYSREMIELRRRLHQYPETALQEFQTQKAIAAKLREIGCRVNTRFWKTSVVGLLNGNGNRRVIGLRADMDALPVTEDTDYPFRSKNEGRMHACGHDSHMAAVWGAAAILSELKDKIDGSVKLVFQPSEEAPPGGAKHLVEKGVLKNPDVDMMFGLHVDPTIPVGKIGFFDGAMMAQPDDFTIQINGRGGHAARPHETIDSIVVAANVILALQFIASRQVDPVNPVVVTVGQINGGTAFNVIADKVVIRGTARTLERKLNRSIPKMIEKIVSGICRTYGASYNLDYIRGYPFLKNDKKVNDIYRKAAAELFGKKSVLELYEPIMGAEDFAYYSTEVPSAMMRIGVRNKKIGADKPWHHPQFKIDEDVIGIGAALLAYSVILAADSD